ncbi:hypothetical protein [Paenibacillus chungangensis]|uniref:ABC transporter substrate-binding protein n=1 Tax=Paenibacillus chungangensis TaxID=696535 RepID=A0ABW3HU83_9BACL
MGKRKMKVWLVVLIAMVMVVSACSNANNDGKTNTSKSEGENSSGKSNNGDGEGAKNEREQLELNWYVAGTEVSNNAVMPASKDDFVKQAIEEKFHVKLNFTSSLISADYEKQLNTKLAADPPHLFVAGGRQSQALTLDGLLADMTPFVNPETMPNYFKHWVSEQELERYAIENSFVRAPVAFSRNRYTSYYIRKDWLDKLQLEVPSSYEDMLEVMRKFTFDDPDGNGADDTYGMSASGNGLTYSADFPQMVHNELWAMTFDKEKGTYRDGGTDLEMEKILTEIKAMLAENIVDPDWFLNKGTAHWDKAANGKAGIVMGHAKDFALDANPNSIQSRIKAIIPEAEFVPFTPFGQEKGLTLSALPGNPFAFHTTVAEKEPEAIKRSVEILDWLASEEGYLLTKYGQEGVHYTREGNTITVKEAYNEVASWLSLYGFFTPKDDANQLGLTIIDPTYTERDLAIIEEIRNYPVKEHIGTNVAPPEGADLGALRTKMREYHVKVLFEEPDASNWSQYHEELMTAFRGRDTFNAYAEQIGAAHGIEVVFDEGSVDQ